MKKNWKKRTRYEVFIYRGYGSTPVVSVDNLRQARAISSLFKEHHVPTTIIAFQRKERM